MMELIEDLWFKRRDIISDGFDESLEYINKIISLDIHEIATGSECWTWIVPDKWEVDTAWIKDMQGNKLVDLKDHPLHVASYSNPIHKKVTREELFNHLHTQPKRPEAIPFMYKYYDDDWGFCIANKNLEKFKDKEYEVMIDSHFEKGNLKVGDFTIEGNSEKTILLMAHLCHPAMVNDDLTGVSVLVDLAKELLSQLDDNYYTYKFLFVPERIGTIAYLSQNKELIDQLEYGVFLEMVGNDNDFIIQNSRQGNSKIDRVAQYLLEKKDSYRQKKFREIIGNDEVVVNGPGIDIPMVSIGRFPYPEYHTSDDTPKIVSEEKLLETKDLILDIIKILEADYIPKRQFKGPVFLSRYDLWVDWREDYELNQNLEKIMTKLEGNKSVFEIANELEMDFFTVKNYLDQFYEHNLITIEKENKNDR